MKIFDFYCISTSVARCVINMAAHVQREEKRSDIDVVPPLYGLKKCETILI